MSVNRCDHLIFLGVYTYALPGGGDTKKTSAFVKAAEQQFGAMTLESGLLGRGQDARLVRRWRSCAVALIILSGSLYHKVSNYILFRESQNWRQARPNTKDLCGNKKEPASDSLQHF